MFLIGLIFFLFGFFQTAKCVRHLFAKAQKITVQFVPKVQTGLLMKISGEFKRQGAVPRAGDIFPELFRVGRENADAAPPTRDGHIPLLRVGRGLDCANDQIVRLI